LKRILPLADPSHRSFSVNIPITVTVSASITPNESTSSHTLVSHLTGLDLVLSRLADFGNVYNGTIDQALEMRNRVKTREFQDFFDFIWGESMGSKASAILTSELNELLDTLDL
jgi:hypothetical protein